MSAMYGDERAHEIFSRVDALDDVFVHGDEFATIQGRLLWDVSRTFPCDFAVAVAVEGFKCELWCYVCELLVVIDPS